MIPMERTHEYHGVYHVLGGALSPIDGIDPEDLKIAELLARVVDPQRRTPCARWCSRPTRRRRARPPRCTSPRSCARARPSVTVTRLASGLPVGSDLEYADEVTLGKAFAGRARGLTYPAAPCPTLIVMKFGGTSVADAERIKRAARRIVRQARSGPPRRGGALGARQDDGRADRDGRGGLRTPRPARDGHAAVHRRADLVRAVRDGDQRPRPPRDLADGLAGGDRDGRVAHEGADPRRARRSHPRGARGGPHRARGGLSGRLSGPRRNVTTLGRGGSDTTAVAVAAALGAEVCEIYTDVAGVYTADPRIVPDARKLATVSFEEMLEMAASGAGVLQLRSVEYARNHGVRIHCRSSFDEEPGTVVRRRKERRWSSP